MGDSAAEAAPVGSAGQMQLRPLGAGLGAPRARSPQCWARRATGRWDTGSGAGRDKELREWRDGAMDGAKDGAGTRGAQVRVRSAHGAGP